MNWLFYFLRQKVVKRHPLSCILDLAVTLQQNKGTAWIFLTKSVEVYITVCTERQVSLQVVVRGGAPAAHGSIAVGHFDVASHVRSNLCFVVTVVTGEGRAPANRMKFGIGVPWHPITQMVVVVDATHEMQITVFTHRVSLTVHTLPGLYRSHFSLLQQLWVKCFC